MGAKKRPVEPWAAGTYFEPDLRLAAITQKSPRPPGVPGARLSRRLCRSSHRWRALCHGDWCAHDPNAEQLCRSKRGVRLLRIVGTGRFNRTTSRRSSHAFFGRLAWTAVVPAPVKTVLNRLLARVVEWRNLAVARKHRTVVHLTLGCLFCRSSIDCDSRPDAEPCCGNQCEADPGHCALQMVSQVLPVNEHADTLTATQSQLLRGTE